MSFTSKIMFDLQVNNTTQVWRLAIDSSIIFQSDFKQVHTVGSIFVGSEQTVLMSLWYKKILFQNTEHLPMRLHFCNFLSYTMEKLKIKNIHLPSAHFNSNNCNCISLQTLLAELEYKVLTIMNIFVIT